MRKLLAQLGHPEQGLNFIHLAGTNGKGSTAAAIDSILREAGFFSGLYTSPHLVEFRERFRCGGVMVGNEMLCRSVVAVIRGIGKWPAMGRTSFVEARAAEAHGMFREANVY